MISMNSISKAGVTVVSALILSLGLSTVSEAVTVVEKRIVKMRPNVIERNIVRGDLLTSKRVVVAPMTEKVLIKKPVIVKRIIR